MGERVGLYGGSFNPIHFGHLIIARSVAEQLRLKRMIFLPSGTPPHKPAVGLVEPQHRAEMVRRAIAGEGVFEYSDFDLVRRGASYTIETIRHFRSEFGLATELFWMIGADSLAELTTWRDVSALVDACRIVTAARPGWEQPDWSKLRSHLSDAQIARLQGDVLDTPRIDISATDIRARVRAGQSIRYLVPEAVCEYIQQHGLYAGDCEQKEGR
ncbi:MAG TPA: nicotinate-nucleotide adenylyltransferase [Phycisphaerae bacterium]|jgi:nicotinate-nucleotide adenylyltransferase